LFQVGKATFKACTLCSHILPTYQARELLKPSKDTESLLRGSIKKYPGSFGFGFSLVCRH